MVQYVTDWELLLQVTKKHFKDLAYVRAFDEGAILQKLIVYTESESDRNNLMVR